MVTRASARDSRASTPQALKTEDWEDRLQLRLNLLEDRIVQLFREHDSRIGLAHGVKRSQTQRVVQEGSGMHDNSTSASGVETGLVEVDGSLVDLDALEDLCILEQDSPLSESDSQPDIPPPQTRSSTDWRKSVALESNDDRRSKRMQASHMRTTIQDLAVSYHKMPANSSPVHRYLRTPANSQDLRRRNFLEDLVRSSPFEIASALMVLGTLVTMSIALQIRMANWQEDSKDVYSYIDIAEMVFVFAFMIEVAIRIAGLRRAFFHYGLNILDLVLASLGVVELVLFWSFDGEFANPAVLRVVRYIRLLKLARISRILSKSKDFHVILHLVLFSLRSMVFIGASIGFIIYMAAFMLMSGVEGTLLSYRGDPVNPIATSLVQQWGSIALSMQSVYMAVSGGILWKDISDPLRQSSTLWLVFFIGFITFFSFTVVNLIIAVMVQNVFQATNSMDQMLVNIRMENKAETLDKLKDIFDNQDFIEWCDFVEKFDSEKFIALVHGDFDLTMSDIEQFAYSLSACGEHEIDLDTLVTGAIQLKCHARRVDLLGLNRDTRAFFQDLQARNILRRSSASELSEISLDSLDGKRALNTEYVDAGHLPQRLTEVIEAMPFSRTEKQELSTAGAAVFSVALKASGGCGFVVTSKAGYLSMQQRRIDFQVTDRSDEFRHGFMSDRLKDLHVADEQFLEAVRDFSVHTDSDKWDSGPGAGLSKDGYILMGLHGEVYKAAVRLAGMPTPPFRWDGVGTRHLAAMAACWSLRYHASVVIVRSDSGCIHTLLPQAGEIVVFKSLASEEDLMTL